MSITPARISLQDYDIKFNPNSRTISSVSNKAFGEVVFKGVLLSDDLGGYVLGSTMKLYSAIYTHYETKHSEPVEMLNIMHIHLND
jgi:hypothetical protein